MESKEDRRILSIFNCLNKSRELERQILSPKNIIKSIEPSDKDFDKIEELINYLRNSVSKPNKNINKVILELELCLEEGNNSKKIYKSFFSSKIFIDCIDLLELSRPEYHLKIFELLNKIINFKIITNYLSKNYKIVEKVLIHIKNPDIKISENAIRLCENLIMNEIVPLDKIYDTILDVYNHMCKIDRLDSFSRIIGILIFNYNKIVFKQIFKNKHASCTEPLVKVIPKNQIICIHLEDFFEKMVKKLKKRIDFTKKIICDDNSRINFFGLFLSDNGLSFTEPLKDNLSSDNTQTDCGLGINENINISKVLIKKDILYKILFLNPYTSLNLDLNKLPKNTQNIYNLYQDIAKHLKLIKDRCHIKKNNKQYETLFKYGTFQIEMLFVLSTLLNCKRKVDVQDKLKDLKIIELLNSYLEYIEWGNIYSDTQRPSFNEENINIQDDTAYHGQGCNCDCDSALKIQYLRLIYSFCCREKENMENKLKLFSQKDIQLFFEAGYLDLIKIVLQEKYLFYKDNKNVKFNKEFLFLVEQFKLNDIKEMTNIKNSYKNIELLIHKITSPDNIKNLIQIYNNNDNQMGLYIKLIFKYMRECFFSSARFWISSCVEIVLRGNNSFFQTFTLYSGLLYCLLNDILYGKQDKNLMLQISFDILGELIKFNRCCFLVLDYYFCDKTEFNEFTKKFLSKDTLIDSNVFLRAIVLSIYFFDTNDKKMGLNKNDYFSNKSQICKVVKNKIFDLFLTLITIVKIENINQSNISCINTAMIILLVQYLKNNKLPKFLKEFRKIKGKDALIGLDNFKLLLKMWKKFYNYRPKDSTSLFYSSNINFNIFQTVTSLLLKEDSNDPCSLYYIDKE
jgi:hypothetical protein